MLCFLKIEILLRQEHGVEPRDRYVSILRIHYCQPVMSCTCHVVKAVAFLIKKRTYAGHQYLGYGLGGG